MRTSGLRRNILTLPFVGILAPILLAGAPATSDSTPTTSQSTAADAARDAHGWLCNPRTRESIVGFGSAVALEFLSYEQPHPVRLWVVSIETTAPGVDFVVTEPHVQIDGDGRKYETACETTLDFARRLNVQLAVNTSAFGPGRATRGQPMDVAGLAAFRGEVFSDPIKDYGVMYVARSGQIALTGPPLRDDNIWNVVAGFRMLLDDGDVVVSDDVYHSSFGDVNPRTAVGVDKDGEKLWIIVADGRQPDRTMGLTLPELASLFKWLGAWDALNLDGGGSSTLVLQGNQGIHHVLNEPIDGGKPGQLRQVASNLGVRLTGARPSIENLQGRKRGLGQKPNHGIRPNDGPGGH